jgi:CDGSH-type Zn-finger protein
VTTTIRLRRNGPYVIDTDDVRVVDWNGAEYQTARKPVALCRCGASARKPFCDGSHARVGFRAEEAGGAADEGECPAGHEPGADG